MSSTTPVTIDHSADVADRDVGPSTEALIKEARRRQHKRWLAVSLAVVLAASIGAAVSLSTTTPGVSQGPHSPAVQLGSSIGLSGMRDQVVMWPVGYPAFGPDGGPSSYVADLVTGRLFQRQIGIGAGDYQPLAVAVGHWLVYAGNGTTAISDQLTGTPRVLGPTSIFAPSARANHVWLVYTGSDAEAIRLVSVTGGPPGPPIRLPGGNQLIAGTSRGLLLTDQNGRVGLWHRGESMAPLPGSPFVGAGFAATRHLVVYGSGCRDETTSEQAPLGNAAYEACGSLRVLNVVTGRLVSISAPPGTRGWVPDGFNVVDAISPTDTDLAAYAVSSRLGQGLVRLFVVRLTSAEPGAIAVPSSNALLFARTAWSTNGAWLFFQGRHARLAAYRVATGHTVFSRVPCCRYTVMFSLPTSR